MPKPLQLPHDLTIVGKKWRKKHKNPVVALQLCKKRTKFQHQLKIAYHRSWTIEEPEKIVIDLASASDEEEDIDATAKRLSMIAPVDIGDGKYLVKGKVVTRLNRSAWK